MIHHNRPTLLFRLPSYFVSRLRIARKLESITIFVSRRLTSMPFAPEVLHASQSSL